MPASRAPARARPRATWRVGPALAIVLAASATSRLPAQARPYPGPELQATYQRMLKAVNRIPIFDHHAHPGFADDVDVDAMASPPNYSESYRTRPENPEFVAAARALWGYPYPDFSEAHRTWLVEKKRALKAKLGREYFNQVLDKAGIEASVANRPVIADYLDPKRFVWVWFGDSFTYPFDVGGLTALNGDQGVYMPMQAAKLRKELNAAGLESLPADLAGYRVFVSRTLDENKRKGGIAMKFEAAYFRSLRFGDPSESEAAAIYDKYHAGGVPTLAEYRTFQDYMMRFLFREAARLKVPVQFHSAVGIGDYFNMSEGNVFNLENVLRDPRYADVTFIMIHGGYPYEREAVWLGAAKNVYLDASFIGLLLYPADLKQVLREWLLTFPEKVMFGSDAFPYNDAFGAEESYWLAAVSARRALAAALAEMVSSGEVSEAQALRFAHMFLHDNAARLYGMQTQAMK